VANRNLLTGILLALALSSSFLSTKPTQEQFVTLIVTKMENVRGKEAAYRLQFRIKNNGKVPIFFPRRGLGKLNGVDTLDLDMLQPDGSWKALPAHRELPALAGVKIGVNEEYDDEFGLEDPYLVSAWQSYPQQPYVIPLRGKLRLTIGYLVGEKEWENYVSARKQIEKPSAALEGSRVPRRQIHSEPFTLP
jgi:hypothetical protein